MNKRHIDSKLVFAMLFLVFFGDQNLNSQVSTVLFKASDNVVVSADLYAPNAKTATFIILYHQAQFSRGEYLDIAPKLTEMGFNCLAVDLRSGGTVNGIENETWKYADNLNMKTRYTDAYLDIQASVSYVLGKYPGAKIVIFGSAYSASLCIKYASDYPKSIAGVIAFSPGEYFSKYGWSSTIIKQSATRVKCPVFITSSFAEKDNWQGIYSVIPHNNKVSFLPTSGGEPGAKALWNSFDRSKDYWAALKQFLVRFK